MILSLIVCLIGGVVYLLAKDKPAELAKIAFGAGLLAFPLLNAADKAIALLKGIVS